MPKPDPPLTNSAAMLGNSQMRTCLVSLGLGMAVAIVVLTSKSKTGQLILKHHMQNEPLTVAKFNVVFPETVAAPLTNIFKALTTQLQNHTSYWTRKLSDFYDVPDPNSSLIGADNITFPNKYIIYRCDNDTMKPCGGWADRVKAMITVYLLANLTGRVFKAENIMADCDLQRFVIPNHVNWSLPVSFHQTVNISQHVAKIDMYAQTHFYHEFPKTDWLHHPMLTADFVYIKGNHDNADNFRQYKLHPQSLQWMRGQSRVSVNRVLFKRLFRPSDYLQNKLIDFLTKNVKSDEKLICAHLRMGRNPTIPNDFRFSINERALPKVWRLFKRLIARYQNKVKIFLMSDSESAIAKAQSQDFKDKIFISPGKIVHVELSKSATAEEKCDGLEKVILEQQVLLLCDSLVITDSGISRMASYLRGRDNELYCLLTGGHLLPCKPLDLKQRIYRTIN